MQQRALFASTPLPEGFVLRDDFITSREEQELLERFRSLELVEAQYLEYTARRRIVSFGGRYDFSRRELHAAQPLPEWLHPLRARVARLMNVTAESIHHALVAEYRPGTPLGWHRDVPDFEVVGGVSLLGPARMRLRPYPHRKGDRTALVLDLQPRSAYAMRGAARWRWQHAISPTKELRYSVTFRTLSSSSRDSDRPRDSRS
jgi:alkylated DNA repair dioxygenase AlkB